jgi:aryl-alcohol dehydrogenase-like predicted oxidoreductase
MHDGECRTMRVRMAINSQPRRLGRSGLTVPAIGVGTNQWGAHGKDPEQIFAAFQTSLDDGMSFFDSAEVYQSGRSEQLLGDFARRDARPLVLASKFAPIPTRFIARSLIGALDATLVRLGAKAIDLYFIHFPITFLSIDALLDVMAECVRAGRVRAVGVSNFSAQQMRKAAARLERHGLALAANQVHYSLLHRLPETNGVLEACRELDVALIAYRPLEGGLVNVPAGADDRPPPKGVDRIRHFVDGMVARRSLRRGTPAELDQLRATLAEIAAQRQKSPNQVALNWLLQRDEHIIVIPGATSARHARENGAALGWALTTDERAAIDRASAAWTK